MNPQVTEKCSQPNKANHIPPYCDRTWPGSVAALPVDFSYFLPGEMLTLRCKWPASVWRFAVFSWVELPSGLVHPNRLEILILQQEVCNVYSCGEEVFFLRIFCLTWCVMLFDHFGQRSDNAEFNELSKFDISGSQVYPVLLSNHYVTSDSLRPHGLQQARLPCPSVSPGVCSNSCPFGRWCYLTISSPADPFPFCLQSLLVSESFPVSRLQVIDRGLIMSSSHDWSFIHAFIRQVYDLKVVWLWDSN